MSIEDAIRDMQSKISAASAGVEMRVVKISEQEARITVRAPLAEMQKIKDATFQPAIDYLNQQGIDVQVFVYDQDAPPLKG